MGDPSPVCAGSAIVLPVAAAEPLVSGWRMRHDASAAAGVPAHVTVIAPFLAPERVTADVLGELRALFGERPAPRVRFARTGRFPAAGEAPGVLYLDPEPAEGLRALTEAVVGRWPEAPPYGGLHREIVPHLTVAISDEATLDRLEQELVGALGAGFATTLERAVLYVRAGDHWRARASLPFDGAGGTWGCEGALSRRGR